MDKIIENTGNVANSKVKDIQKNKSWNSVGV